MTQHDCQKTETHFDQVLSFTLPDRDSRGRMVRLGPALKDILDAHQYPTVLKQVLSEALVLTALMSSMLKNEKDQLTLQARSESGPIRLLVCDYSEGKLRGYIERAEDCPLPQAEQPTLGALFGKGHLAIIFDVAHPGQRYQGIVPLEGSSLAGAVENYFVQSEQLPTLVRTSVDLDGERPIAGGMLVQHLPEGEEGRERLHVKHDSLHWEHVAILSDTLSSAELVDGQLPLESLIWRLFHEDDQVLVSQGRSLRHECGCSEAHYESILSRFSKEERRDMVDERGIIVIDCAFCSSIYEIQD